MSDFLDAQIAAYALFFAFILKGIGTYFNGTAGGLARGYAVVYPETTPVGECISTLWKFQPYAVQDSLEFYSPKFCVPRNTIILKTSYIKDSKKQWRK